MTTPSTFASNFSRAMVTLVVLSVTVHSHASPTTPTKEACAESYEAIQRLRLKGDLHAAYEQAATCAQIACPLFIRSDCIKWAGEIRALQPSIVVVAHDADGGNVFDSQASLDGVRVADRLPSPPIEVDPGEHLLHLEANGYEPVDVRVMLQSGEKGRTVVAGFGHRRDSESAPTASAHPQARFARPVPPIVWILGSIGIAVTAVGTYFEVTGLSKANDLNACRGNCPPSRVSDARTTLWVGNVTLGTGGLAIAGAMAFYLFRPRLEVGSPSLRVDVQPSPYGATVGFIGDL